MRVLESIKRKCDRCRAAYHDALATHPDVSVIDRQWMCVWVYGLMGATCGLQAERERERWRERLLSN